MARLMSMATTLARAAGPLGQVAGQPPCAAAGLQDMHARLYVRRRPQPLQLGRLLGPVFIGRPLGVHLVVEKLGLFAGSLALLRDLDVVGPLALGAVDFHHFGGQRLAYQVLVDFVGLLIQVYAGELLRVEDFADDVGVNQGGAQVGGCTN